MQELLIKIESLCLELPTLTLLLMGVGGSLVGLLLWFGGTYYSGIIVTLLGAGVGSLAGLLISRLLGVSALWTMMIGAAGMALIAAHLQNLVIVILAVVIFALSSGTGYLSFVLNGRLPQKELPETIQDTRSLEEMDPLERMAYLDQLSEESRALLEGTREEARGFWQRLRTIISDTWQQTTAHRWKLVLFVILGGLGGLALAWLIKKIVMALCCSMVGSLVTLTGVQLLLLAKKVTMMQALQSRPNILPILFTGMVLFGWAIQIFIVGPAKKKKKKIIIKQEKG